MGLHDLLWACPFCQDVGAISTAGACRSCGVTYRRDRGATIRATLPDGRTELRSPAGWVDRMPDPDRLLDAPDRRARVARVNARSVTGSEVVRGDGRYLNRIEIFGPAVQGTLELAVDRLIYRPEGSEPQEWEFDALTAVQASSSTLQIKGRHRPLVAFRFPDDSVFLWETLLRAAVRRHYRRAGRGEIAEFQPRIVTR